MRVLSENRVRWAKKDLSVLKEKVEFLVCRVLQGLLVKEDRQEIYLK